MRILIAEDDITSRAMLGAVLKKAGHEVTETSNGAQAWARLQEPEEAPPPGHTGLDDALHGRTGGGAQGSGTGN